MSFGKSFTSELGKNTGKWVSNKVFGNSGWATPRRHIIEVEGRKKLREEAKAYKLHQNEIETERIANEQQLKQLEREAAERQKQLIIKANEEEVYEHNNYLNIIQSVHKTYSDKIDWLSIQSQEGPLYIETAQELKDEITKFTNDFIEEEKKQLKIKYKPSFFSVFDTYFSRSKYYKLFHFLGNDIVFVFIVLLCFLVLIANHTLSGFLYYSNFLLVFIVFISFLALNQSKKEQSKKKALNNEMNDLESQRSKLLQENMDAQDEAHRQYLTEKEEHQKIIEMAAGVLNKNPQAYRYALNYFKPFEDMQDYGSDISISVSENKITADFYVHSENVIPKSVKRLLRKGLEVREDELSQTRFNEIYQDYVCSSILKIAKEIFQLLPGIEFVQVNAKGTLINTATGHFEEQTIVSVKIDRNKLESLNFELLDPSDSMANFIHEMNFSKRDGFKAVDTV